MVREGDEEGRAVDSLLPGRHQSRSDAQLARAVLQALRASGAPQPAGRAPCAPDIRTYFFDRLFSTDEWIVDDTYFDDRSVKTSL